MSHVVPSLFANNVQIFKLVLFINPKFFFTMLFKAPNAFGSAVAASIRLSDICSLL